MGNMGKNAFLWFVIVVLLVMAYNLFEGSSTGHYSKYKFSEFLERVESGQVSDVTIRGNNIEGHFQDGSGFITYNPGYDGLVDKLAMHKVQIDASPNEGNTFWALLLSFGPVLLLIGLWILYFRQMQGGGGRAMGFGRSRAKLLAERNEKVTFNDVAGIDEAKEELHEIVDFLKDPQKYTNLGGKIPKGCLLIGPPGTGKTLLARAIAGEANVPFFTISGSDFVEMFVGVGASRVRDMFEQGKKNAPCIIFIDEIDAVGRHRGIGYGGGNDEREQTLNQLLVEMDGFEANEGVILIAATNRPDVLDPALLRPGRFDRQITVSNPDILGREKILEVHLRKVPVAPNVDARIIARGTPGFSGAQLANLVNEAALLAARCDKKLVTMKELEEAKDKVLMGVERKSMVMTEEEKKLTAYHEAGHAIVAVYSPSTDPIHKATIIPRGRALGLVQQLPERDQNSITREQLHSRIAVFMGGRVAEELIFGYDKVTSGASSDIRGATQYARGMVTEWGMSDKVGPLFHGDDPQDQYMGMPKQKASITTANLIDEEIKAIVDRGYKEAQKILEEHLDKLHALAKALLEYETLSGDEILAILDGKNINRNDSSGGQSGTARKSTIPSSGKASSSTQGKNADKPGAGSISDSGPQEA